MHEHDRNNLCYSLEYEDKYIIGGKISGVVYKYPIFKKLNGEWTAGSSSKPIELTDNEALNEARKIRELLIKAYNIIKSYNFNTLTDYINFYKKLDQEIREFLEPIWVRKYYHMMFPNLFINFHKNELQEHILLGLGIIPGNTYFERCGQLIEVNKNLGWYQLDFSNACYKKFSGNIKSFYRIGSTDSNGKKYAEEWKEKGIIAIGWKELGDLRQYDNGKKFDTDKVKEKLLETNNNYKTIAPTKAKEIKNFYKSDENSIFVVADGEKIIGLVDNIGDYEFDSNNHMSNYKKCHWSTFFQDNIKFPNKNEWYLTSCVKITNKENLLFLYNLYYWNERNISTKIAIANNKTKNPLNTILYGPPGTGKTYNTVIEAMRIINPNLIDEYEKNQKNYDEVKEEFDKAKKDGQIEFITFHQSYAYEEFVEGIKPCLSDEWGNPSDNLTYKGTNGVFKKIANRALFDRLDIKDDKKNKILNFEYIKDKFIEKYQVGDELETIKSKSKFKIEKYTEDSIRIRPFNSEYIYSVSFNYLEEAFNKNLEKDEDIVNIIGMPKGLTSYYRSIYCELIDLYNIEIKNRKDIDYNRISSNEEISNEQKLRLIKEYYENKEENKISLKKDLKNSEKYVLVIDEINRGNISKIFGELITLLEEDKRENLSVRLPYSHEEFTVPKNLYIIGTMNTSDRSIASIDIALRRRFTFKEMMPDSELVADFGIGFKKIFEELNNRIRILLDRDHQIGHSYFIKDKYENANTEKLKEIWFNSIMPLLNEYFYNDWDKLKLIIPGFIKAIDIPQNLKDECESAYEFKTISDMNDNETFKNALNQIEYKEES